MTIASRTKKKLSMEDHRELAALVHGIHSSFVTLWVKVMNSHPRGSDAYKLAEKLNKQIYLASGGDLYKLSSILSDEMYRDHKENAKDIY